MATSKNLTPNDHLGETLTRSTPSFPPDQFPGLVRSRRKQFELSPTQLAAKIGASTHTVCRWERGKGFPRAGRRIIQEKT